MTAGDLTRKAEQGGGQTMSDRRFVKKLGTAALALVVFLTGVSAFGAVLSKDLDGIDADLKGLEATLAQMRGRYVQPLLLNEERSFDHRFARAQFLYRSGDYVHASILLSDLLTYPQVEKRVEYYDLLWYLGDSLARNDNFLSARQHLESVVSAGQDGSHFSEAIIRLIQISVKQQRFSEAETYYKMMSRSAGAPGWDLIQYAYAKSLHRRGQLDSALNTFKQISETSSKYPQAVYFVGVILVEKGSLQEAYQTFESLRALTTDIKDKPTVALNELSTLAMARILFEQQEYEPALSLYRLIPVNSDYFDQAYYETTWIYIQKEKYTEAANTLDILLLARPESIYSPDAQVLKGNIHMLEGRFDDARSSFQLVINKYSTVVETLDGLLERSEGKSADAIQQMLFGESSQLPPVALAWLSQEEDVAAAIGISKSLDTSVRDTEDAHRIIASLRLHLTQESKANLFPALREGREEAEQMESRLTALRKKLVELELALVGDRMSGDERAEMDRLQQQRRNLELVYDKVPKTIQERHDRQKRQLEAMEKMEQDVHQLTLQMAGMREMIALIMTKREQMRGDPQMSQVFLKQVEADVAEIQSVLDEMNRELRLLQRQVAANVERTKIGDDSRQSDVRVRERLEAAIAVEKAYLERMRNRLNQEEAEAFDRIESYKRRSDRLDSSVEVFYRDLETIVAVRVDDFMAQVDREEQVLSAYSQQLAVMKAETEELAATIAYQNMQVVRDRFYSVYLKANVGNIDIAWEKRQRIRDRIDALLDQRAEEQRQLNESFEGIR
jgi:tetratricopeptide (TPR) repeat protein